MLLTHALRTLGPKSTTTTPTLTFQNTYTDSTSQTTRTISSVDFGTATSTREIFIVTRWSSATSTTISSATIGGVTATISAGFSAGSQGAALIFATVPTGTTGNVVITYSNATTNTVSYVYRVTDRTNIGVTAINRYGDTVAITRTSYTSPTVAFPANGFVLAIFTHTNTSNITFSATGITIDADTFVDTANRVGMSYNNIGGSAFSGTYSLTWGGSTGFTTSRIWTFD